MAKEKDSAQKTIDTIRRKTQRKHSAEEKIRIVPEGLRGHVLRRQNNRPGADSGEDNLTDRALPGTSTKQP
ncbi:MAG: hypothetical protein ACOCX5_04845 [Chloroflexota bacterium]